MSSANPGEIVCAQCGEPFQIAAVQMETGDMDEDRFLNGDGCPCCEWGTAENATGEYVEEHNRQLVHGNYDGDATEYLL